MSNICSQCYLYRNYIHGSTCDSHGDPFDVIMNGKYYQAYCIPSDQNQSGKINIIIPKKIYNFDFD
ncbi:hypothetical protein CE11_00951 [Megavirus courdo11]|uniref:Uncharacterized protein n=1 Tax=Megavirus courdo11 TaxID=1128140 RepID=K7YFY0_9VIRU|nr:hypothetical protein CE11_00951 [Megavirus courdo11]